MVRPQVSGVSSSLPVPIQSGARHVLAGASISFPRGAYTFSTSVFTTLQCEALKTPDCGPEYQGQVDCPRSEFDVV